MNQSVKLIGHRRTRRILKALAALLPATFSLVISLPTHAEKSAGAKKASSAEDPETGIRLSSDGKSRMHLNFDAGAGFDTNPYATPFGTPDFAGDVVTRLRPGLGVTFPGRLISFDGDVSVDYGFMPGVVNAGTRTFLLYNSGINLGLEVNRGGAFNFAVGEGFAFRSDPGQVLVNTFYTRLNNNLKVGGGFRPGGGTLAFKFDYQFGFEKYFDFFNSTGRETVISKGDLDSWSHYAHVRADYRFLPRTGVFADIEGGYHGYVFGSTTNANPTGFPLWVEAGVMGQFTPSLNGLAQIGYGNPFILNPTGGIDTLDASSHLRIGLIGQLELRWNINKSMKLSAGVKRDNAPVAVYQYMATNRAYLRYSLNLGRKLSFGVNTGYSIIQFGKEAATLAGAAATTTTPKGDRLDGHLDLKAEIAYYVFDWLSFGLSNDTDFRLTNTKDVTTNSTFSYFRNETLALMSLHY